MFLQLKRFLLFVHSNPFLVLSVNLAIYSSFSVIFRKDDRYRSALPPAVETMNKRAPMDEAPAYDESSEEVSVNNE